MPSAAKLRFDSLVAKAQLLCDQAGKLKKKSEADAKTVFLHAALTTQIAAWDVYVKAITLEYFSATSDATNAKFSALHSILQSRTIEAGKKLNTPNSENCRNHLLIFTGFDPWPCWVNINFGTNLLASSLLIRNRLDEIFTLRHSFAHGLTMPTHTWNTNSSGSAHLSCLIVRHTKTFITQLCEKTDHGIALHIASQHSITRPW